MSEPRTLLEEILSGDSLTDQEIRVLYEMARGHSSSTIAKNMFLANDTVKTYRKRAIAKLQAKNAVHAVVIAIAHGIIDISQIVDFE